MSLLDTNTLSELRRRGRMDARVRAWARGVDHDQLFLSSITLLEIEIGVLMLERRDPAGSAILRAWVNQHVLPAFSGCILPVNEPVALRCGPLHVPNRRPDQDAMIAATALTHSLIVATRNVRDFAPMGVTVLNPWEWDG